MRTGYLGPEGTFSHQALLAAKLPADSEPVAFETIYQVVMAVHDGLVEQALVPIENSLEGSVDVTLDALATDAHDVAIVGETVQPIRNCLIAARAIDVAAIETLYSHPQPAAQCARLLRGELAKARVVATSSTAESVRRVVSEPDGALAALGNQLAAERYGATVLIDGVDDDPGNETRFVWLRPTAAADSDERGRATKTSIVFWGAGDEAPGWLVRCLSEFSERAVNLTRIESRPRRVGLGHYMFFCDLAGGIAEAAVAEAIERLRGHCEEVRVLGSYRAG